jgi:hypothetical protein
LTAVAKSIGWEPWLRARTEAGCSHSESTRKVEVSRAARAVGSTWQGVRADLPFALATGVLGVSFGAFGVLTRSLDWGVGKRGPVFLFSGVLPSPYHNWYHN